MEAIVVTACFLLSKLLHKAGQEPAPSAFGIIPISSAHTPRRYRGCYVRSSGGVKHLIAARKAEGGGSSPGWCKSIV